MAHKRENDYFELLCLQVAHCTEAAGLLQAILADFDPAALQDQLASLHQVEHRADLVKHEMMEKLLHEFITPIEREDIAALSEQIDDLTAVLPQAVRFGELIGRCCQALEEAMEEFRHFRRSPTLYQKIVALNELEGEGDQLYTQAVRSLYTQATEPAALLAWSALYDQMESCCDACEHVADIVETVVMKNS